MFPFSHDARVQLAGDFHVIFGLRVSLEGSSTWNEPTSSNLWNHLSYSHRSNKCIWFQLEDTEVEDEPPVAETNDIDGVQCPVSREVMVFYMLTPGWCTPSHVTALKVAGRVVWHCLPLTPLLHLFLPPSFFFFCLRVLWSGRRDLGEPGFVRTLSVSAAVH